MSGQPTSPISMSTRDLRRILREVAQQEMDLVARVAYDIYGPGGSVFIAARTKLTERHLAWLEQRNPASSSRPTYVDVVIATEGSGRQPAPDYGRAQEPVDSHRERRRQANEISRDVAAKAEEVGRQATQVYRIVGSSAFTAAALSRPEVRQNLAELDERIGHFHSSVRAALDEYLVGNTLIMDLISRHDLASRMVQHGLNVAVFATEIASQVMLGGGPEGGGLAGHYRSVGEVQRGEGDDEGYQDLLQRDLAEVFLGGFMHDCGMWHEETSPEESHEVAGARLLWSLPELQGFLPSLTKIVLFHSDILRMATKPGLVQVIEHPDDPAKAHFRAEFYRTAEDAATAAGLGGAGRPEVLTAADVHKVLPVAISEYCITQSEGFNARSRPEAVGRLAGHAQNGLYAAYVVALCNAQIEAVAPRRAYVSLSGHVALPGRQVDLEGCQAGSMWHTDDMYSPHLVTLFAPGEGDRPQRLDYVSPHDPSFWGRGGDPRGRLYVPAGRHRATLALRVTGFMSEDVYTNILGEYELELKRQMQP
ncbi:hypothetical protein ACFL6X_04075 [Candidatus Latescibacterota bacterium]